VDELRLFLHLLAATVWVGGQLVLGALVPTLRRSGPDVPRAAARAFSRVAWPAFGVLLVTGAWNVAATGDDQRTTLLLKLAAVAASGATAYLHAEATTVRGRAVFGALTGVSAVLALLLGVLLSR
jgi:putative copper export protein